MENIIGQFYFKKTTSGNLIGEFTNNNLLIVQTESAEVVENFESFKGTFNSCWSELNGTVSAELSIDYKPNSDKKIFDLIWSINNEIWYWGEGFIVDNLLVGSYRDFQ